MNKQKFVQYLRTPAKLDQQSLTELETLISEFPYFQNARTLLAKGSKQSKSKKSAQYIGTAAVYATDRALLKRYINDQLIFLNPLEVHESHEADLERDLTDTIKTSRIVSAHVKQTSAEEKAPPKKKPITRPKQEIDAAEEKPANESLNTEATPTAPSSDLDHIIDELYRDMEELKVNRAKFQKIENQLAEEEAVDNAVKKATDKVSKKDDPQDSSDKAPEEGLNTIEADAQLEDAKEVPETNQEKVTGTPEATEDDIAQPSDEKTEPKPLKKASESRSARRVSQIEPEEPKAPKKKAAPKKTTTRKDATKKASSEKKSTDKQATKKSAAPKAGKTKTTTKKDTAKKTTGKKSSSKTTKSTKSTKEDSGKKEDKSDRKNHQDEIITNFIKVNPSISPGDSKAPRSEEDLSGNSTELHPDIASEYLAEIYLEQGRTERAIQIYESLMVRIPEKSVYFADIIKKLNEEK